MNNMFSPSSLRKILTLGFIAFVIAPLNAVQNITEQLVVHKNASVNSSLSVAKDLVVGNKAQVNLVDAKKVQADDVHINHQLTLETPVLDDCCRSISGIIHDFDPHRNLLAVDFCRAPGCPSNETTGFQGAWVNLSFCTTCTTNPTPRLEEDLLSHCPACSGTHLSFLVDKLYVHPALSPITNLFHFFAGHKPIQINADHVYDDVPRCCKLKMYVNQNPLLSTRMLVGLVQYDSDDTFDPNNNLELPSEFWSKKTCQIFQPGCLFYEVKGCNLFDVAVTTTDATAVDTLPDDIKALIIDVTSDTKLQEALALDILGLGQEFMALLQSLDATTAKTVVEKLLSDISKGRTTLVSKIKSKNAQGKKGLLAVLRSMSPSANWMLRSEDSSKSTENDKSSAEKSKSSKEKDKKSKRCKSCGNK